MKRAAWKKTWRGRPASRFTRSTAGRSGASAVGDGPQSGAHGPRRAAMCGAHPGVQAGRGVHHRRLCGGPVSLGRWHVPGHRVPLLIYLPDLTPGQAIRWTSRLAAAVAVSFPEVAPYFPGKAVVTGYPVRAELLMARKDTARATLNLDADLPLLLVFGGSRGAHSINQALLAALPQLLPICQVVHISGQLDWPAIGDAGMQIAAEFAAQTGDPTSAITRIPTCTTRWCRRWRPPTW